MLYRLTQCSPIRDYRIPQFVEPWCGIWWIWWIYSSRFDTFLNLVGLVGYNIILTALKPLWSLYQFCTYPIRGSLSVLYFDIWVLLFCPSFSLLPKSNDFPACSACFNFLYLCFLYWQWSGVVPYLLITISMELRDGCQPARPSCPQSPH